MRIYLGFAGWLVALAAVQVIFAVHLTTLLLALAGAAIIGVFGALAMHGSGRARPRERAITEASLGAAVVGVGAVIAVVGVQVGAWCLLLGAGAIGAGLLLVLRERRTEPRPTGDER